MNKKFTLTELASAVNVAAGMRGIRSEFRERLETVVSLLLALDTFKDRDALETLIIVAGIIDDEHGQPDLEDNRRDLRLLIPLALAADLGDQSGESLENSIVSRLSGLDSYEAEQDTDEHIGRQVKALVNLYNDWNADESRYCVAPAGDVGVIIKVDQDDDYYPFRVRWSEGEVFWPYVEDIEVLPK
jgi:hypothetical protein